jgi:hypothetical protein
MGKQEQTMAFYPNIRDETIMTLNVVVQNLAQDPTYLSSPECPYSDTVKKFFYSKVIQENSAPPVDIFAGEDELMVLDEQIIKVINDLESFGKGLSGADVAEKMAYFRTKTALIEKLVTMRERLANLKEINEFRLIILNFMNEELTKDQITALMLRLDGVLGTKTDDLL